MDGTWLEFKNIRQIPTYISPKIRYLSLRVFHPFVPKTEEEEEEE